MEFYYNSFGLTIGSCLEFPELVSIPKPKNSVDVQLVFGKMSDHTDITVEDDEIFLSPSLFFMNFKAKSRFLVVDNNRVIMEPYPEATELNLRSDFLRVVLAYILIRRGHLVLHANAIAKNNDAIVFIGESGAGKSSVTAAALKQGFSIFTDDTCAIDFSDFATPRLLPSYPYIRLWDDAINALKLPEQQMIPIPPTTSKFKYPIHQNFARSPVAINKICLLELDEDLDELVIKKINDQEKFSILLYGTFCKSAMNKFGMAAQHFQQCQQLIKQANFYRVQRPNEYVADEILERVAALA